MPAKFLSLPIPMPDGELMIAPGAMAKLTECQRNVSEISRVLPV